MLGWLLLFSLLLAGLFVYLATGEGDASAALSGWPLAAGIAFVLVSLYAMATRVSGDGGVLRRIAGPILALTGIGAAVLYAVPRVDFAALLSRAADGAGPGTGNSAGGLKSMRIRRNAEGKFIAQGSINGVTADFLIDTGASAVVLRQSDAARAGIDTPGLDYSVPVETANGQTHAAAVRLRTLDVGPLHMDGVEVLVAERGSLNENLLGMSFLRRLRSYEISGDFVTLRE